ncbi:cyanoexosortase B [Spirulina subsalsa]|uniref:cyanoexosortase B n=1 Tax=Spirulina subsalsa TaxID=54311 RepID=UPI0003164FC4|nr:cyanoexosortase B [Spirulina subsalsa]
MVQRLKNPAFLLERRWLYAMMGGLFILLYAPLMVHWVDGWLNKTISIEHEYFSHGLIGFPFAAYIVWLQRKKWRRLGDRTHPVGGILLALGALCYFSGTGELVNLSLPILLTGLCLWLKGVPGLKLQGFPLILVWLATPNAMPYLISPFSIILQTFIANVAGFILIHAGMDVQVESIYLTVGGRLVEVAPHCSGLKMLFTSLYVGLMLLYWTDNLRSRPKTIALLLGAAFISVTANILRNTLLTYFHGSHQDQLFAWLHEGWGGDLYSAGMLGLVLVWMNILDRLHLTPTPTLAPEPPQNPTGDSEP